MGTLTARMRAAFVLLIGSAGSAAAQEPVWPIGNGQHDLLHSFQNPFNFGTTRYFHEGVDHRGSLLDVVAVRSGVVRYVGQGDAGGTLLVEVQTPNGVEADSYLHVLLDPWTVGQAIQAGDRVGRISDVYFSTLLQDHVHVNRFRGWAGGNGYVTGRTNMMNPLRLYALAPNRDPQQLPAQSDDANEDGVVFHVAPSGLPTTRLPYAFGSVELFLEATDRLTNSLYWNQGVSGMGYWVESRSGGEAVASAAQPYRLVRFDDAWRQSHANCDTLLSVVMLDAGSHRVQFGPDNTGWSSLATYRLTRAGGFTGLASELTTAQTWMTLARVGGGAANGTGAELARESHEARFRDGLHRVHVLVEDLVGEREHVFDAMVDNFRPYVESLRVTDVRSGNELYRAEWAYDSGANSLRFSISFPSGSYAVRPGAELLVELVFSEPMAAVGIVQIDPSVGTIPVLESRQPVNARTVWTGKLTVAQVPAGVRAPGVWISGKDLAGTTLYPHFSSAPITPPFNRRANANPINGATRDTLHVLPLAVDASVASGH